MKIFKILYIQVLIGIGLGGVCGWLFPGFAPAAKLINETFINMIRMVIAPVIFFTIVLGVAGAGNMRQVGRVGGKALLYFELMTTCALLIGVVVANVVKPGAGVVFKPSANEQVAAYAEKAKEMNWGEFLSHLVPANVVDAFATGDILQVLFFSILFAFGLRMLGAAGKSLLGVFDQLNKVLFNVLKIVMRVSPIGAFGGMAFTIGKFGFATLAVLGKLLLTFYLTGILFIFVVLWAVCKAYGVQLWKLLSYIKTEILIVIGASSSESVLPTIMQKLTDAGCDKEVVGLVIPAGYSFNLDGTTIYLSLSILFLAQVFQVDLSMGQQLTVVGILMLTSKGAAGIAGSGFIVLASTLTALKVIPLEGLGLLFGVDRFMSEGRAVINVIGNTVATVVISKSEHALDENCFHNVVHLQQTSKPDIV
ncbi:aerobic C4-dicarboxylate transport protein [Chitinophaga costaii]|uniref:Aerobic C4-dicarboxylate transport protein n=1 Tax=Chitinophaga costaii TaxID=1335309 RepID=A0A1C4FDY4_9BACT|nr:C4-dicarboxylate transporter DctA [Chitinophaga costaii]PUZ20745.1 C4-dicarboxylate transporter DctA [Chitinophaga costaii]SCC54209.1 aerobic C4-dicarboxylate transport protein [Chitinophaga costaii]